MESRSKGIVRNFSYSFLANGTNTLISMLLVFFVPKVLGIREYSYWQLYIFYTSYVGFFHLGWADGIYLKFGGKKYEDLDKGYFNTQFWLLTFFEIIVACFVSAFAIFLVKDVNKSFILVMTGICCILQIPRTFLQYLLQTTNRITDYAKNYLFEKIVYAILVITFLSCGVREFEVLILADLVARGVTLLLLVWACRDIVLLKVKNIKTGLGNAYENISVGIKLLFANIANLLILGIVRFAIENKWSVEVFGKVSLTITASNLLMVLITSISIVIYPMIKSVSADRYAEIYTKMRNILMAFVLGLLIVYYPAKVVLSWWLPQYAESLRYMALLFPMCVFESKMNMLVNTYLKALRKESTLMWLNNISIVISLILTIVSVYILGNLVLSIALVPVILGIRCFIGESYLAKELKMNVLKDTVLEITLAIIFVCVSWCYDSWMSMAVYASAYIVYLLFKKNDIKESLQQIKFRR